METESRVVCRAGSMASLAIALGYVIIIALYVPMGAPGQGAAARLTQIAAHQRAWWAILALSVITDLLFLPLIWALYQVLKPFQRPLMVVATVSISLFVILDLTLTWTNYAALIPLSDRFAHAGSEAHRAAITATAEYPTLIIESSLLFFYNSLSLALGILVVGIVMRRGVFGQGIAWIGITGGILGIVSVVGSLFVAGSSAGIILTSILTTIWTFLVGLKLRKLARCGLALAPSER